MGSTLKTQMYVLQLILKTVLKMTLLNRNQWGILTNNMAIRILGRFKGLFAPERDNSPGTVVTHFKLGYNVCLPKGLGTPIC